MKDLWLKADQVIERARASGVLEPITTDVQWYSEQGIPFCLRTISHRKPGSKPDAEIDEDPFVHFDPTLLVTELGEKHHCLLNKYPVLDRHLLIVTREYEPQTYLLNRRDFYAAACGLKARDALVFYNSGSIAGASQSHKHLQLVGDLDAIPFSPLFDLLQSVAVHQLAQLSFEHRLIALPEQLFTEPNEEAQLLERYYLQFSDELNIRHVGEVVQYSYNLLLTRQWMMLIPRRQETVLGVSINALGFVGNLLVRNAEQLDNLKHYGLMRALKNL